MFDFTLDLSSDGLRQENTQVMVSYYLQVALTIPLGPLLPFIIRIAKKRSFQPILHRITLLEELLLSVVQTTLFYSSSLYIAAVVRYAQSPSISELVLLGPLLKFQLSAMSFLLCGLVLEWRLKDFSIPFEWLLYSVTIVLSQGLTCIVLEKRFPTVPEDDSVYYERLSNACDEINMGANAFYGLNSYFFASVGMTIETTAVLVGLPGIWLIMYLIPKSWKRLPEPVLRRMYWKKIKLVLSAFVLFMITYLFAGCIVILVDVSKDVKEDNWGYGQTTAVLIWAPFLLESIKETISKQLFILPTYSKY